MQAPRIPKMFGIYTKQPNQFDYTPRYYDERKEKLNKRIAQIKKEVSLKENKKELNENYTSSLNENWGISYRNKTTIAINKRVVIYLVALLGLAYYLIRG